MAYVARSIGRIYVLRWTTAVTLPDVDKLIHELPATRRQAGEPLIAFSIISAGIGIPDGQTRRVMLKHQHIWAENCEMIFVVLEDTGFPATLVRAVLAELLLVTKRGIVKVFSSVDAAIVAMAMRLREQPGALRRRIEQTGVLE
ncbi:hypothetical protein LVJ94_14605 [Pendulispora rubella]|uniref:Uncharacterized protein n=1 Tax=Pendulispora rubella TaxID=2741070 RepID=A0ABZ2LC25_9BACT